MLRHLLEGKHPRILLLLIEGEIGYFMVDRDDLAPNLTQLYEIEYKYSMLKHRTFIGLPQRKKNIIKYLEKYASKLIKVAAGQLLGVYEEWLSHHAITNPEAWAKDRVEQSEYYGFAGQLEVMSSEYDRYSYEKLDDTIIDAIDDMKELKSNLRAIYKDISQMDKDELYDLENTRDEIQASIDELDVKVEELKQELSDIEDEYDNEDDEDKKVELVARRGEIQIEINYQDDTVRSNLEADLSDLEGEIEEFESRVKDAEDIDGVDLVYAVREYSEDGTVLGSLKNINLSHEQLVLMVTELYQYCVFPMWFDFWRARGIVQTREKLEVAAKDLERMERQGFRDRKTFGRFNEILNMTHQTGSMVEYVQNIYPDVTEDFLEDLSDMDTSEFDDDLRKVGVDI
jgi:hypothetical protein